MTGTAQAQGDTGDICGNHSSGPGGVSVRVWEQQGTQGDTGDIVVSSALVPGGVNVRVREQQAHNVIFYDWFRNLTQSDWWGCNQLWSQATLSSVVTLVECRRLSMVLVESDKSTFFNSCVRANFFVTNKVHHSWQLIHQTFTLTVTM